MCLAWTYFSELKASADEIGIDRWLDRIRWFPSGCDYLAEHICPRHINQL